MENIVDAMIGFVGALLSTLMIWIRSDIKTHRAETNAQFQALQAQIDRRFDEQRDEMNRRFDEQRTDTDRRFDEQRTEMNRQFEVVDRKLDTVNVTLALHGERIARVEVTLDIPQPDRAQPTETPVAV